MGLMGGLFELLFGGDRNVVRETAEVFRVNAEAQAGRDDGAQERALRQFAEEFTKDRAGAFDRFMDGLNRVPRPALALGTILLFVAAMVDPVWFAERMGGLALVPEPLWWLLGAVVSFYFGARHQLKSQTFQRDMLATLALAPQLGGARKGGLEEVIEDVAPPQQVARVPVSQTFEDNAALSDWAAARR